MTEKTITGLMYVDKTESTFEQFHNQVDNVEPDLDENGEIVAYTIYTNLGKTDTVCQYFVLSKELVEEIVRVHDEHYKNSPREQ